MQNNGKLFRSLMGRFVTGVTVIAASSKADVAAMTANAVSSVSVDPLILLCCIRNESSFLPVVLREGRFSVNVLSAGQDDISRHYGGRRLNVCPADWALSANAVPVLVGANASFVCHVDSHHRIGDHTVVYGAVDHMEALSQPSPALLYASGSYIYLPLAA